MQYSPNIDMAVLLDVEHKVRIALEWPGAQAGQIQLIVDKGTDLFGGIGNGPVPFVSVLWVSTP